MDKEINGQKDKTTNEKGKKGQEEKKHQVKRTKGENH